MRESGLRRLPATGPRQTVRLPSAALNLTRVARTEELGMVELRSCNGTAIQSPRQGSGSLLWSACGLPPLCVRQRVAAGVRWTCLRTPSSQPRKPGWRATAASRTHSKEPGARPVGLAGASRAGCISVGSRPPCGYGCVNLRPRTRLCGCSSRPRRGCPRRMWHRD